MEDQSVWVAVGSQASQINQNATTDSQA
jgi:hypothetical protein